MTSSSSSVNMDTKTSAYTSIFERKKDEQIAEFKQFIQDNGQEIKEVEALVDVNVDVDKLRPYKKEVLQYVFTNELRFKLLKDKISVGEVEKFYNRSLIREWIKPDIHLICLCVLKYALDDNMDRNTINKVIKVFLTIADGKVSSKSIITLLSDEFAEYRIQIELTCIRLFQGYNDTIRDRYENLLELYTNYKNVYCYSLPDFDKSEVYKTVFPYVYESIIDEAEVSDISLKSSGYGYKSLVVDFLAKFINEPHDNQIKCKVLKWLKHRYIRALDAAGKTSDLAMLAMHLLQTGSA